MPLYEFVCKHCNTEFTVLCDVNTEEAKCECGEYAEKIISKSNWVFNTGCYNPLPPKETKKEEAIINDNRESRVLLEFMCENCGELDERYIYPSEQHSQICEKCNSTLKLSTCCTTYELKYNPKTDICNWHGESSQYWSKVKEERRSGKQVKGLGEK